MATNEQRKAALAERCIGHILGSMAFWNPYWAARAHYRVEWHGRYYLGRVFYFDPNSGGRVTYHVFYEGT